MSEQNKQRCREWNRKNKGWVSAYNHKKAEENKAYWSTHDPYLETKKKQCCHCRATLPRTAFYKECSTKSGLNPRCKDCTYLKNGEGAIRRMLSKAKVRAKQRGLEFSLKLEDIKIPPICPILGIPMSFGWGRGYSIRKNYSSPSLDRRDNSKGYTKANVQVISVRANCLKSDASIEELEAVIQYMKSINH